MRGRFFICNTPSAAMASSVLHRPVESATRTGRSGDRKADTHGRLAIRRWWVNSSASCRDIHHLRGATKRGDKNDCRGIVGGRLVTGARARIERPPASKLCAGRRRRRLSSPRRARTPTCRSCLRSAAVR